MSNTQTTSKIAEDYFHLYLGCEVIFGFPERRKKGQLIGKVEPFGWQVFDYSNAIVPNHNVRPDLIMPILRPLESMTEEEAIELAKLSEWEPHFRNVKIERNKFSNDIIVSWQGSNELREEFNATGDLFYCAEQFQWLLKKGFDLFELIYYGLALDRTKL
jgi:hypothetical protein